MQVKFSSCQNKTVADLPGVAGDKINGLFDFSDSPVSVSLHTHMAEKGSRERSLAQLARKEKMWV